ncbi:hypothetical protein LCGC14_2605860, partial [marine sediment metagenome]
TNVICNGMLTLHFGVTETIGSLSGAGLVQFRQGTGSHLIVGNNNSSTIFAGRITPGNGDGALTKIGSAALTLTGDSTYSGGTIVSGGALQIGGGSATGSILGDVTNNASLIFNRSDDLTFGGAISGTGSVTKLGANTLTLTGANTYAGGTTIADGKLVVDNDLNLGSAGGIVTFEGGTFRSEGVWAIFPSTRHFVANGADAVFEIGNSGIVNGGICGSGGSW